MKRKVKCRMSDTDKNSWLLEILLQVHLGENVNHVTRKQGCGGFEALDEQ